MQHINEDTLELIALGRLSEPNLGCAEEHLLICETCRERLSEADEIVATIRAAVHGDTGMRS
jgi:hypothetical protein